MRKKIYIFGILVLIFLNGVFAQNYPKLDPIYNFDQLWTEFNDRYASFDIREINWDHIYDQYRKEVTHQTSESQLFDICCRMLQELSDGHVNILMNPKHITRDNYCGATTFSHIKDQFPDLRVLKKLTDSTLQEVGFKFHPTSTKLLTLATSVRFGYLRIDAMTMSRRKLKSTLKASMKMFIDKEGVILDIRFNGGGDDKISFDIAGRFTDHKMVGHYKRTRKKGTKEYSPLRRYDIHPNGKERYTGPTVLLTSNYSASAADVFAMIMKELPHVTLIGNHTEGIFSDMQSIKMPNGWVVTLSHQQYFSAAMINYEGQGIAPEILVKNFRDDSADPVILRAIEKIGW